MENWDDFPEEFLELAEDLDVSPKRLAHAIQMRRSAIAALYWENNLSLQGPNGPKRASQNFNFWLQTEHLNDFEFQQRFRLSRSAFEELENLLRDDLSLDKHQRHRGCTGRGGVETIDVPQRLAVALRLFAGASVHDLVDIYKMSVSAVYQCAWMVVDAVNKRIQIRFPIDNVVELQALSDRFQAHSPQGVWKGCVGCIDGVHFKMLKPPLSDVANPIRYYVARKSHYALLCIAVCDYDRKFLFYSMSMAASTHDSLAWTASSLGARFQKGDLPLPYFLNGDNAFSLSNSMIIPSGVDSHFDFVQSSCRMPIECAFGILIKRWGILWRPLQVAFNRRAPLIGCLMRLHNWCIDHRVSDELQTRKLDDVDGEEACIQPGIWVRMPEFDSLGRPVQHLRAMDEGGSSSSAAGPSHACDGPNQNHDACSHPSAVRVLQPLALPHTHIRDELLAAVHRAGIRRPGLPMRCVPQSKGRTQKPVAVHQKKPQMQIQKTGPKRALHARVLNILN